MAKPVSASQFQSQHSLHPLTRELLTWISSQPRRYAEVMEAWRSTCPRHSVWEDALADGLIEVVNSPGLSMRQGRVMLTARGNALLEKSR